MNEENYFTDEEEGNFKQPIPIAHRHRAVPYMVPDRSATTMLREERRRRIAAERELAAMSASMPYEPEGYYNEGPDEYEQMPPRGPRVRRSVYVRQSMYGQSDVPRHRDNRFWS